MFGGVGGCFSPQAPGKRLQEGSSEKLQCVPGTQPGKSPLPRISRKPDWWLSEWALLLGSNWSVLPEKGTQEHPLGRGRGDGPDLRSWPTGQPERRTDQRPQERKPEAQRKECGPSEAHLPGYSALSARSQAGRQPRTRSPKARWTRPLRKEVSLTSKEERESTKSGTDVYTLLCIKQGGFPGRASGKEPACPWRRLRDVGSIPRSGRSPEGGHSNPLQYSCLENPMDRGAWQATVHGATQSDTTEVTQHNGTCIK